MNGAGIAQAKESQSRQAESSRWRRGGLSFESAVPGPGGGGAVVAPAAPLVGRDADVSAVAGVLAQAGEGAGSLVLVSGEAGNGKTRLCAELSRWHRRRGGRVLLGRAAAQEASIPFAAVADALRGARRMRWALAVASECSDQRERLTVRVDDRESCGTSRPRIPALMPPEWCRGLGPPMQAPCTCSGK